MESGYIYHRWTVEWARRVESHTSNGIPSTSSDADGTNKAVNIIAILGMAKIFDILFYK
jgi:hypothetical protein